MCNLLVISLVIKVGGKLMKRNCIVWHSEQSIIGTI